LTTLGRRSGKPRRLALIYGQDGDRYVIEVQVQVHADRFRAHARTATPEEHQALWPRMAEIWPD
jgi:hypothetical protein